MLIAETLFTDAEQYMQGSQNQGRGQRLVSSGGTDPGQQCDEDRPRCKTCQKGWRPCTYTYADKFKAKDVFIASKSYQDQCAVPQQRGGTRLSHTSSLAKRNTLHDQWQLRTSRHAPSGGGTFQSLSLGPRSRTAKDVTHPTSIAASIDSMSSLTKQWLYMLGSLESSDCSYTAFSPWLASISPMLGYNGALDAAAKYVADSHALYSMKSDYRCTTELSGYAAKAMKALRGALITEDSAVSDMTIMAVTLVLGAEVT